MAYSDEYNQEDDTGDQESRPTRYSYEPDDPRKMPPWERPPLPQPQAFAQIDDQNPARLQPKRGQGQLAPPAPPPPLPFDAAAKNMLDRLTASTGEVEKQVAEGTITQQEGDLLHEQLRPQIAKLTQRQQMTEKQNQQQMVQKAMQDSALQISMHTANLAQMAKNFPKTVAEYVNRMTGEWAAFQPDKDGNFKEIEFTHSNATKDRFANMVASTDGGDGQTMTDQPGQMVPDQAPAPGWVAQSEGDPSENPPQTYGTPQGENAPEPSTAQTYGTPAGGETPPEQPRINKLTGKPAGSVGNVTVAPASLNPSAWIGQRMQQIRTQQAAQRQQMAAMAAQRGMEQSAHGLLDNTITAGEMQSARQMAMQNTPPPQRTGDPRLDRMAAEQWQKTVDHKTDQIIGHVMRNKEEERKRQQQTTQQDKREMHTEKMAEFKQQGKELLQSGALSNAKELNDYIKENKLDVQTANHLQILFRGEQARKAADEKKVKADEGEKQWRADYSDARKNLSGRKNADTTPIVPTHDEIVAEATKIRTAREEHMQEKARANAPLTSGGLGSIPQKWGMTGQGAPSKDQIAEELRRRGAIK